MKIEIIPFLLCSGACAAFAADVPAPKFNAVTIDDKIQIGYGVTVADVDGDKLPDILLADKNQIVWYQNPGAEKSATAGSWRKHIIAENLTKLDHVCIAAADINDDGKCEIAVGAGWNPGDTEKSGAVFYLIAPVDRTQKWEPVALHHEPTVHRMRWVKDPATGVYQLIVVPLHGRGNKGGAGVGVNVLAYKKPADPRQPWTTSVVNDALHMTHNFDPLIDGKGAAGEILLGGKEGTFRVNLNDPKASVQLGGNESNGAGEVRAGKLTAALPFFATVEPMHGNNLVVYIKPRPDAKPATTTLWNRLVLDPTLVDGHALACGDLLGLGRDQIVVGWRAMGNASAKVGIKIFTPLDADGKTWRPTLVDDNTMACEDLCLADLNADGKLDIIAAGRGTKNVKIYLNLGGK